jgi:predicted transcriptional regulator
MTKVTSIRLSDELAGQLDQLATSLDRPKAWVIEQAIARYLEQEASEIAAISEALAEYRSGQGTLRPHDELMDELDAEFGAEAEDANPLA